MILDTLTNAARCFSMKTGCSEAFGFLDQPDLADIPDGKYPIMGDRIFAIVERKQGRTINDAKLEGHRKYIDIQYVVSGEESMGWSPVEGLTVATPYDPERDLMFFEGRPQSIVRVPPGAFAIFHPSDAHMPLLGDGPIHKIVVKVAVGDT